MSDGPVDWTAVNLLRARGFQVVNRPLNLRVEGVGREVFHFWQLVYARRYKEAYRVMLQLPAPAEADLFERFLRVRVRLLAGAHSGPADRRAIDKELAFLAHAAYAPDIVWLRVLAAITTSYESESFVPNAIEAFNLARRDPWWLSPLGNDILQSLVSTKRKNPQLLKPIVHSLAEGPFSLYRLEDRRLLALLILSEMTGELEVTCRTLQQLKPNPFQFETLLKLRLKTYQTMGSDMSGVVEADLKAYQRLQPRGLTRLLEQTG